MRRPQSDLNISDAALELRIRRSAVVRLVTSGMLVGYVVSPPGAKRPAYRITREALDEFKRQYSAKQQPKRRKAVPQCSEVIEFF